MPRGVHTAGFGSLGQPQFIFAKLWPPCLSDPNHIQQPIQMYSLLYTKVMLIYSSYIFYTKTKCKMKVKLSLITYLPPQRLPCGEFLMNTSRIF